MLKVIIVDDEQHCINRVLSLLARLYASDVEIVGAYLDIESAAQGIITEHPDLVFMDVHIHEHTGFDLLSKFDNVFFDVIFTTAYEQYAIQAFKHSALDYLLKPVDEDDLSIAMEKVISKKASESIITRLEALMHNLKQPNHTNKRICIPLMNKLELIQTNDIIRCESEINYTKVFMKDRQKIVVAKTLKEFEEQLSGLQFCRVHNSHLVNLHYVKSYNKGKGGYLTLTDGTEVEVAVRRKDLLMDMLNSL